MINVVAAIIENSEGKILIAQRNMKKAQGGLWEFPGGKIETNETRENAIVREIKEELDADIEVNEYFEEKIFKYPEKEINLIALKCNLLSEKIKLNEHENMKWVYVNELNNYNFAPADIFIVEKLRKSVI
ncbi:MAG: 8-oxo-dGTP diphosphatase MutT [Bacilli bacterium]